MADYDPFDLADYKQDDYDEVYGTPPGDNQFQTQAEVHETDPENDFPTYVYTVLGY